MAYDRQQLKQALRARRATRARAKVHGTAVRPRLAVARSLRHISAQLIDDTVGRTLLMASDTELKAAGKLKPLARAEQVGALLAQKALAVKITAAVFDRAGFKYHGRVKALADGARQGGLQF